MTFFKVFLIIILFPSWSYAYVDPGSGSLLLQILGSIFVGIAVFFKSIKMQIENVISKIFKKQKTKR